MAKAPATLAIAAQAPAHKAGPSFIVQMAALLVLSAAAAGGGWFSGQYLEGRQRAGDKVVAHKAGSHDLSSQPEKGGHDAVPAGAATIVPLEPITTNLAAPADVWLRLELSLVLDQKQGADLPNVIHQDVLAFVRTLKLHQIEGPSGLQHFKEDLVQRAILRSDGHVKDVLIRTMLFE
jgi:flagellar FliL protein